MKAIRWSIRQAAVEFGLDRATMTHRLRRSGQLPGHDGKYATREIYAALTYVPKSSNPDDLCLSEVDRLISE